MLARTIGPAGVARLRDDLQQHPDDAPFGFEQMAVAWIIANWRARAEPGEALRPEVVRPLGKVAHQAVEDPGQVALFYGTADHVRRGGNNHKNLPFREMAARTRREP